MDHSLASCRESLLENKDASVEVLSLENDSAAKLISRNSGNTQDLVKTNSLKKSSDSLESNIAKSLLNSNNLKPSSFKTSAQPLDSIKQIPSSFDDNYSSKSCEFKRTISPEFHSNASFLARSQSEDLTQKPKTAFQRNLSLLFYYENISFVHNERKLDNSQSETQQYALGGSGNSPDCLAIPWKVRFSSEKRWIFFCLCLANFTAFLSMSIIAPFFPGEAKQKGMREAVSGFVFSIYAFVVMVFSPIFGKILPSVGSQLMLLIGIGLCGVCNILFGFLDKVDGSTAFTILCFIVRSFEALGAAAFSTASYTILIDQFPYDIGTVFGFTETCVGVGMSIGPAVGGALYTVGGFGLPFFTLGCFVCLIVPICYYLLRNINDPNTVLNSPVSYLRLLKVPHVIVVCIILAVTTQSQSFISPTLEPHMEQFGLDASVIGLLFLLFSAVYTLSSPVIGWVSGKMKNKYPLMVIGLLLIALSLMLLGPSELLPIIGSVQLSIIALTLMGFSFAVAYVPTFESMFIAAINGGLEDDISTYSVISGLWNSFYSLGEVTGPLLGGILSDYFTFPRAATIVALCTFAAFIVAAIAWINPCKCFGPSSLIETMKSSKIKERANVSSHEETPLYSGKSHSYGTLKNSKKDSSV